MNSRSQNRRGISVRDLLNPCTSSCEDANQSLESLEDGHRVSLSKSSRGPWKLEEDRLLAELVSRYGPCHWSVIAAHFPNRTGKQARERWTNQLNPKLKKKNWSPEEDYTILVLRTQLGNKWSTIAGMLPGRTDNSVKNRFNSTLQRAIRDITTKSGIREVTIDDVLNSLHSRRSYRLSGFATSETLKRNCGYKPNKGSRNEPPYDFEEPQSFKRSRMSHGEDHTYTSNAKHASLAQNRAIASPKRKTSEYLQTASNVCATSMYGGTTTTHKTLGLDQSRSMECQLTAGYAQNRNGFINTRGDMLQWMWNCLSCD